MPPKRKKGRGRGTGKQARRSPRPQRTPQQVTPGETLLRAARSQPGDITPALTELASMLAYGEWVGRGRPEAGPGMMPPLYCITGEAYWPEAVDYALEQTYAYVARALDLVPWSEIVESLSRRAFANDEVGRAQLNDSLRQALPRFSRQYRGGQIGLADIMHGDTNDPEIAIRRALLAYTALYEIDLPLWYLGVLGRAHSSGRISTDFLGGPEGSTAQGAMINEIQPLLQNTPLELPLSMTYDAVLRNAINHNDYEIVDHEGGSRVYDHRTARSWDARDVYQRLLTTSFMVEAIRLSVMLELGRRAAPPRDAGVLTFTCDVQDNEIPIVVIGQLAAFRDLDPEGEWIDKSSISIDVEDRVATRIALTERARIDASVSLDSRFEAAVRNRRWTEVLRLPLAPSLGLELPVVQTHSGGALEVVGPPDRHFIPIAVRSASAP